MPYIVQRHQPVVYHVGHLEDAAQACPVGEGIIVTSDPDSWRGIKGANGPEWEFCCSDALWVDMLALKEQDHRELQQWMLLPANRYMRPSTIHVTNRYCSDADEFVERRFTSLQDAAAFLNIGVQDELEARERGQGQIEDVETFLLTRRALRRLSREHDPLDWFSAAAFLYVREVVMPKRPLVVGLWWNEAASRDAGTAPHGILMPEALVNFTVEGDDVPEMLFVEAFPKWQLPDRKTT